MRPIVSLALAALVLLSGAPARASDAAEPFAASPDPEMFERSLQCLTEAVYYEARSESEEGQRAVAQVVLNRVRHPAYPNSVCGVVYQGSERVTGCQFSFTCDGALGRPELAVRLPCRCLPVNTPSRDADKHRKALPRARRERGPRTSWSQPCCG